MDCSIRLHDSLPAASCYRFCRPPCTSPPPQVVLFYLPHFSASCLCRHQINTKITELWVHWILSCECNKLRWLEKVSMQSVAPLCSQDLRQMQEKQKRIEKDSACWKSRVNSLYWIINMMRFTILILHTCQQAYDFPVNFLQAKKIQVDFCQWCCYQWGQSKCSVCRLMGCTGCFSLYKHAFFSVPLPGEWHSSKPDPATIEFITGSPLTWMIWKNILQSYAEIKSVQHGYSHWK